MSGVQSGCGHDSQSLPMPRWYGSVPATDRASTTGPWSPTVQWTEWAPAPAAAVDTGSTTGGGGSTGSTTGGGGAGSTTGGGGAGSTTGGGGAGPAWVPTVAEAAAQVPGTGRRRRRFHNGRRRRRRGGLRRRSRRRRRRRRLSTGGGVVVPGPEGGSGSLAVGGSLGGGEPPGAVVSPVDPLDGWLVSGVGVSTGSSSVRGNPRSTERAWPRRRRTACGPTPRRSIWWASPSHYMRPSSDTGIAQPMLVLDVLPASGS